MSNIKEQAEQAYKEQKESVIDVSTSQATGRKLKKYINELMEQLKDSNVYPSTVIMTKKQYKSVQNSRKLRRLKDKQWEFLKTVSPPENFLFYSKQHVMGVLINETR